MIKPFKILTTRIEDDGTTGITYEVTKVDSTSPTVTKTQKMSGYMSVPQGEDIDTFLFNELIKAGWL